MRFIFLIMNYYGVFLYGGLAGVVGLAETAFSGCSNSLLLYIFYISSLLSLRFLFAFSSLVQGFGYGLCVSAWLKLGAKLPPPHPLQIT